MCLVKNHNEESRILDVIDKIIGLICVYLCNPQDCSCRGLLIDDKICYTLQYQVRARRTDTWRS